MAAKGLAISQKQLSDASGASGEGGGASIIGTALHLECRCSVDPMLPCHCHVSREKLQSRNLMKRCISKANITFAKAQYPTLAIMAQVY